MQVLARSFGMMAASLGMAIAAHSANVSMKDSDAFGQSSFNSAGHWNPSGAPAAGNAYYTANFILRTPANAVPYTFVGDSLSVDAGGHLLGKAGGSTQVITVRNLILNGGLFDQANDNGDHSVLTLAGNVTVSAASGLGALGGMANGSGAFEILNITAPISGSADLLISGPHMNAGRNTGVVRLSAANSYRGDITVDNGVINGSGVIASSVNRILHLNNLDALKNATLSLVATVPNPVSFASAANKGPFNIGGLAGTASQTLTDTSGSPVVLSVGGNNANSLYSGVLTGPGALVKVGAGALTLSGANTYTGGTTVSRGTLIIAASLANIPFSGEITNNSAVIFNIAGKTVLKGRMVGNGALTKAGLGTLTLSGSYQGTGPITVQEGTLSLKNDFSPNSASLSLGAGSFLQVTPNTENTNGFTIGDCRLANATLKLDMGGNWIAGSSAINVLGTLSNDGITTVNILNAGQLAARRFPLIRYSSYQSNALSGFVAVVAPGGKATIENNPANHSLEIVWQKAPADFCGLSCPTPAADENPIYENGAFRFFADRMEAWDVYAGTYRSTNGFTITKDGDAGYTWTNALLGRLYLQTPFPILDACYALGVSEMLKVRAPAGTASAQLAGDQPGGQYYAPYYFMTHGSDIREYSRDSAQHIQLGDSVIIDPEATRGALIRRCDFSKRLIREDAVQTADNIHFIPAAWEYFKITGDIDLLSTCWSCMSNTIFVKEATCKDTNDGLWTGSPWSDNPSGFVTATEFRRRQTSVKSLYANLIVAMAWRDLGNIAVALGRSNEAPIYAAKAAASKKAVNAYLYCPEMGTYCYYKYQPTGTSYDYREDMSAGLLNLSDTADAQRCMDYHARFTPTAYGYRNVDPVLPSGAASSHGGNVWENEEAYHGWAMARLGMADELMPFIFWHARLGLAQKNWREGVIDPSSGALHSNYSRMIWAAMGYTSYWSRGIFGMSYQLDGIHFSPCVPSRFGKQFYAVLNNFTYRNASLRIILTGCGTAVQQVLLDGMKVSAVPANLSGSHHIQIKMENSGSPVIPAPRAQLGV